MLNTDLKLEETGQPQAGSIAVPEKKGTEENSATVTWKNAQKVSQAPVPAGWVAAEPVYKDHFLGNGETSMFNIRACDSFSLFATPTAKPNRVSNLPSYDLQSSVGKTRHWEETERIYSEISLTKMKQPLCCICPSFLEDQRWGGSHKKQNFPSVWPPSTVPIFCWMQEANNLISVMFSQICASFHHIPPANSMSILCLTS